MYDDPPERKDECTVQHLDWLQVGLLICSILDEHDNSMKDYSAVSMKVHFYIHLLIWVSMYRINTRRGIEICSLLNSLGDCSHISLQTSLETKFSQTLLYYTRNKFSLIIQCLTIIHVYIIIMSKK